MAALLQQEGVRRLYVVDDLEIYGDGLADMVRSRDAGARAQHTPAAATCASATRPRSPARSGAPGPTPLFFGGVAENGAARLWRAVHRRNPKLKLFAAEGVTDRAFARGIPRGAAQRTLITNPTLDPAAYPPAAQGFSAAFRARFGHAPRAYGLYGYEAMSVTLDAIARAGSRDRRAVVNAFFATKGPRLRARPLLDRRQRRHHAVDLRGAQDRRRPLRPPTGRSTRAARSAARTGQTAPSSASARSASRRRGRAGAARAPRRGRARPR